MSAGQRRRARGGALLLGLLVGGLLVTGVGAILWGKNAVDRKAHTRAQWEQAEGIFDARTEKRAVEALEGFNKERAQNLGATAGEGGQVALSVQTAVAGPVGTVVDLVLTAGEAKEAAGEYRRLLGRAPPNDAEARLLALQRKAMREGMKSAGLPAVGALEDRLLKDHVGNLERLQRPGELERARQSNPGLYGRLDDARLLQVLTGNALKFKMGETAKSLDGLRKKLKSRGLEPTPELVARLIELRYTEGQEAFQKEVARLAEAVGGPYDGTWSGAFAGQASGTLTLSISRTTVSGRVSGRYGKDPITATCQGSVDQAGNLQMSLSGAFVEGDMTFGGSLRGRIHGESADGKWFAANEWDEPVGSWTLQRQPR